MIYKTDRTRRNAEPRSKAARRESNAERVFHPLLWRTIFVRHDPSQEPLLLI